VAINHAVVFALIRRAPQQLTQVVALLREIA
jgi:hypothetical protein